MEDFHKIHEIIEKIDGLFITGGRDIHPKYYNQEVNGSKVFKEVNLRFMFTKTFLEECPI